MKVIIASTKENNGQKLVKLRFKTIDQLLDPDDPSPLERRELTQEAEDAILNNVCAYRLKTPVSIELQAPGIEPEKAGGIADAIRHHFRFVLSEHERDTAIFIRERQVALALTVLNLVLAGIYVAILYTYENLVTTVPGVVIGTILVIMNWATIWDTYEYFIFDTRQKRHQKKLLEKIINGDIRVLPAAYNE